jgi:hypothetical protein
VATTFQENETLTAKGTATLEELKDMYASARQLYGVVLGSKLSLVTVPCVLGVIAWSGRPVASSPFLVGMAITCVVGSASILIPNLLAKRRYRMATPWNYTVSRRAISFGSGQRVETLTWDQVTAYDEGLHWIWIYATERDGIPILKRLFAESELEIFRSRLSHAQPGAARVAFHRQTTPLLLWMLLIAAALAYFQLVGEGRAR